MPAYNCDIWYITGWCNYRVYTWDQRNTLGVNFNNSDFAVWAANGGGSVPWHAELLDTRLFYSGRWWCLSEKKN